MSSPAHEALTSTAHVPEVLAPAGDRACLEAAIQAGADAVYFGLSEFNARARATNFSIGDLASVMRDLHRYGAKGYVTLNTVLFDQELSRMQNTIAACAEAGADAIIVQDLGVAALAQQLAPSLHVHASTQMTCTDAAACNFAQSLGVKRVILARELSIAEIATIHAATTVELEAFVHGALCIAYSGQCLTSEAVGGRSANRGACAQACRLPYELVVDGKAFDLQNKPYILSPQDLESSHHVGALARAGIRSLKIEGRLKGVDYVRATVRLYREAIEAWQTQTQVSQARREQALQTFSRSSSGGFFEGVNHQTFVPADSSDHRGLTLGRVTAVRTVQRRTELTLRVERDLARGHGILVQGERGERGELGGRVWEIADASGAPLETATAGSEVRVWLGPDVVPNQTHVGRAVFRTSDPALSKTLERERPYAVPIHVRVEGASGMPLTVHARSARGHVANVVSSATLEPAQHKGLDVQKLEERLGKLGETPFVLTKLESALEGSLFMPPSALNEVRRAMVDALATSLHIAPSAPTQPVAQAAPRKLAETLGRPGVFVLCRNKEQATAALEAGAEGVGLDFLELTGTGECFRMLREKFPDRELRLAPPRVRKPKEEKIDAFLAALSPHAMTVRGLGALWERSPGCERSGERPSEALQIGDFSLNITNAVAARLVLEHGLHLFTPAFDLDESQLIALLSAPELAARAEVVVHHPMPLFYMEHCVFAAVLSEGADYRSCGRPCDRHVVSLKDRAGFLHPLEADVGCRNTVFHAKAQSAAHIVPDLRRRGVRRFRIEAVRETAAEVDVLVRAYQELCLGEASATETLRQIKSQAGYGVVRGSLRVLG